MHVEVVVVVLVGALVVLGLLVAGVLYCAITRNGDTPKLGVLAGISGCIGRVN